jgi:acyl carrier protein phosphodiesterase
MNYLAHLYLADAANDSLVGQLLGDFVKGGTIRDFRADIQAAIYFHRKIDSFADSHPFTRISRNRVAPQRRRFAGIVVDVCYDHFLARNWHHFADEALPVFIQRVYADLQTNRDLLTADAERVLTRMVLHDWLGSYGDIYKVGVALDRIAGRITRGERFMGAIADIQDNYQALQEDFFNFFPELVAFARTFKQHEKG